MQDSQRLFALAAAAGIFAGLAACARGQEQQQHMTTPTSHVSRQDNQQDRCFARSG